MSQPTALSVAGTDPMCGAGAVADAVHIASFGVQPLVVETAWVTQDSSGVAGFVASDRAAFEVRLQCALADGRPRAIKAGMLASADLAQALGEALRGHLETPLVLDPVMAGGGPAGGRLGRAGMVQALRGLLRAGVLVTPNVGELALLLNEAPARDAATLARQARELARATGAQVLAKGGHLPEPGTDAWVCDATAQLLPRVVRTGADVHGTGCALSAAICARLALGDDATSAVVAARRWLGWRLANGLAQVGRGRRQLGLARKP